MECKILLSENQQSVYKRAAHLQQPQLVFRRGYFLSHWCRRFNMFWALMTLHSRSNENRSEAIPNFAWKYLVGGKTYLFHQISWGGGASAWKDWWKSHRLSLFHSRQCAAVARRFHWSLQKKKMDQNCRCDPGRMRRSRSSLEWGTGNTHEQSSGFAQYLASNEIKCVSGTLDGGRERKDHLHQQYFAGNVLPATHPKTLKHRNCQKKNMTGSLMCQTCPYPFFWIRRMKSLAWFLTYNGFAAPNISLAWSYAADYFSTR